MITIVAIVHLIFCLLLIALVLLQDPKNSGAGAVFGGGGTNSLLGATGAVTFLTRLTRYSAVVFGITCLALTLLSRPNTGSVLDSVPAGAAVPAQPLGPKDPSAKQGPMGETPANTLPSTSAPAAPQNAQPVAPPTVPAAPSGAGAAGQPAKPAK